jgi:hypothetical protein
VGEPLFKRDTRNDKVAHDHLLAKLSETNQLLIKTKNGKTIFENQFMRDNYTNPYLKHPETRNKLENFLSETQPE